MLCCVNFSEVLSKLCGESSRALICVSHHWVRNVVTLVEWQVSQMATKAEKANYSYRDFYCFMSFADFTAYISTDDSDEGRGISISFAREAT